ncbi:MAG: HlyD family efflux transporter periplasmic adaptor subunit [Arenimonas sp.]
MSIPGYAANPKRARALIGIGALVLFGGLAYAIYWFLYLSHYQDTDDAYVQGNVVQVTPQVAGTVVQVNVHDTDAVQAGQLLVALDPADARAALDEAEATLAQTVREVRQVYGNDASTQADIRFRQADAARAGAELARAEQDLARRRELARRQLISREDLAHAQATVDAARSALLATQAAVQGSRSQLDASRAIIQGVDASAHPKVQAAAARVREALISLQRTKLSAPVGGIVARRSVQLGQRVAAGTPMLAIIPLDQVWVDANFKEVQLRDMRVGQPVTLSADVFGKNVVFHGTVAGFGAGTGAAFALIPAQNATGNWIKVVQRVPVRIALDAAELRAHPLRLGLSMKVEVDIAGRGKASASAPVAVALQDSATDSQAEALIARIVADNLGQHAALATDRH